jgi:hypothetical protein
MKRVRERKFIMLPENQLPLVAVTTETLLGVATPVMVGVVEPPPDVEPVPPVVEVDDVPPEPPVELVEAVSPEPPQPAIKPAAAAAHAKPRSCLRNSVKLIYNTSRLDNLVRPEGSRSKLRSRRSPGATRKDRENS